MQLIGAGGPGLSFRPSDGGPAFRVKQRLRIIPVFHPSSESSPSPTAALRLVASTSACAAGLARRRKRLAGSPGPAPALLLAPMLQVLHALQVSRPGWRLARSVDSGRVRPTAGSLCDLTCHGMLRYAAAACSAAGWPSHHRSWTSGSFTVPSQPNHVYIQIKVN